ncbi:MAG: chromosome partitioning protein ParB [Deltaproteobacteria bacterium]|jgi:hypothetical protein|nr:chromosome partitioning protein ParB [Deltaproteobacteria bacterium]
MQKPATVPKPKAPRVPAKPGRKRSAHSENVPLIRVNFDISRSEHTKLKIYAAKLGVSMADILRSYVTKIKISSVK